jgi:hypothetical protein
VTVVALAGRRIDAPDAETRRFPPANEDTVREQLRGVFEELGATTIVSSAACGADLVALEVAGVMGLRRVVVLPWERDRFRERSVVDRGQAWGKRYDRVVDEVQAAGDLRVLGMDDDGDAAYGATTEAILHQARELAGEDGERGEGNGVVAIPVWEGRSRGPGDFTEQFVKAARAMGMRVREVRTL